MKRIAVSVMLLLTFAVIVNAGPLDPNQINGEAKWLGHVNFDAIRSLKIVQDMKTLAEKCEQFQAKKAEMVKKLGMNPLEDLQGVTLYSTRYGGNAGVVLISVKKVDREKMLTLLKEKHPDFKTVQHGKRNIHSWVAKHHGHEMKMAGALASDKLIVLGADVEQIKAALDVIQKEKPALAKDAPLLKGVPRNALAVARVLDVPEQYSKETKCPVLRICKAVSVQWTEKNGTVQGKYELTTTSEDAAKNLKKVAEGFKALLLLHGGQMEAVKKVVDGIKIDVKADTFRATITANLDDIQASILAHFMKMKGPEKSEKK